MAGARNWAGGNGGVHVLDGRCAPARRRARAHLRGVGQGATALTATHAATCADNIVVIRSQMQALGWRYVLFPGLFGALLLMLAAAATDEMARARLCWSCAQVLTLAPVLCLRRSDGFPLSLLMWWRRRAGCWAAPPCPQPRPPESHLRTEQKLR